MKGKTETGKCDRCGKPATMKFYTRGAFPELYYEYCAECPLPQNARAAIEREKKRARLLEE